MKKPYHKHKICKYGGCPNWKPGELRCGYRTKEQQAVDLNKLHRKAWEIFSRVIRRSEKGICFTCGTAHPWKECDAGHFVHGKEMDFVDNNIHCQCVYCNKYRAGNGVEYTLRMIRDYGHPEVDRIYGVKGKPTGLDEDAYKDLIDTFMKMEKKLDELGI